MYQFLTHTLRVCISSWSVCSACFEGTFPNFIRALSARINSWCVCSVHALVHDVYAQHVLKGLFQISYVHSVHALVPDAYAQCTHHFLAQMLSICISSCRTCSLHISAPYAHAGKGIQNEHLKSGKTDMHAEHARKELMRMLRVRISSWHTRSVHTSVPDSYRSEHTRKEVKFFIPKKAQILIVTLTKLHEIFFALTKKILLNFVDVSEHYLWVLRLEVSVRLHNKPVSNHVCSICQ
jgi:hypothetical protein